ncbi:endothelial cell-specific chemotaxis regulator isoform X1 [Rhincodon typus]|uniref:endothelial cell-specific chemotaxis regulator isoform X1 n=1 Tax=Rhincodon typus TaxID=259920 RepID=UPI00202ED2E1|nr:endothelial cell-specific chemotaxis regulator isoform X1 [Rhincodon typus]
MANLKVSAFLIFLLFQVQKGNAKNISTTSVTTTETNPTASTGTTNTGETVKTTYSESPVIRGKTNTQDAGSQQTTRITVSSISSVTDTSTIVPSTGSKNATFETITPEKNETADNTTTVTQSTLISVASTRQNVFTMMSTNKAELTDPAPWLEPTLTTSANGSSPLSVLAFAVIILILILVIVVVILFSVISLRFKCCDFQDASQDIRKARNAAPSESSQANGEKESITLVSMRTLSTETGGPEPSMQGSLQNDAIEAGETDKHFQQINNTKLV